MREHLKIKNVHVKKLSNVINRLREQNNMLPMVTAKELRGSSSKTDDDDDDDDDDGGGRRRASSGGGGGGGGGGREKQRKKISRRTSRQPRQKNVGAWRRGELIGQGAYGKVYQGFSMEDGSLIAVKQILTTMDDEVRRRSRRRNFFIFKAEL